MHYHGRISTANSLTHFGKKGMKWKKRKKQLAEDPIEDARNALGGGQNGDSYLKRVIDAANSADKKSGYSGTKIVLQQALLEYKTSKRQYKDVKESYKGGKGNDHDVKSARYNTLSKQENYKSAKQTNGTAKKQYREEYHRKMYGTSSTSKNGAR